MPRSTMIRFVVGMAVAVTIVACSSAADGGGDELTWVTSVDSTSDTVRVRITGDVPESDVRTLIPELEVGSLDGAEETSFGDVTIVLGALDDGLIVLDDRAPAVRLFDSAGAFVRSIGRKGSGPGEYEKVNGMARLPDGRLAIWDFGGSRMNLHAADGAYLSSWRVPFDQTLGSRLLWTDAAGDLYAHAVLSRDASDPRVQVNGLIRLDATGRVLDSIPFVTWRDDPRPAKASTPDGGSNMTWMIPFGPRNRTRVLPTGGLVSGYGDPYVFYILPRAGKPVRVERERAPVPVTSTEAAERRALIEFYLRRVDPSWGWSGVEFPTTKAAYQAFDVGEDGRIWVRVSTPAEPIPAAEIPERVADQPPVYTTREPTVYDVYSPEGRLLGRVAVPLGITLHTMEGDRAWGVRTDSLGVGYAVRMRISGTPF